MQRASLHSTSTVVCAAATLLCLAACTSTDNSPEPPPISAKSYDPPVRFDAGDSVALWPRGREVGRIVVHGELAFLPVSEGLVPVRTTDGKASDPIAPPSLADNTAYAGYKLPTPVLAAIGGKPSVLAAFALKVPGRGTEKEHLAADLAIVDATRGTGDKIVRWDFPRGTWDSIAHPQADVVGAHGDTVILNVRSRSGGNDEYMAVALDVKTGRELWKRELFRAVGVLDDVVVGVAGNAFSTDPKELAALGVDAGTQRWKAALPAVPEIDAFQIGPKYVLAAGFEAGLTSEGKYFVTFDAAGTTRTVPGGAHLGGCTYDDQTVAVCEDTNGIFGIDAATGDLLWSLPDGGRDAPKLTTAWHGAVYGELNSKPIILDARSGTDRELAPGIGPVAVNGKVGVAQDGQTNEVRAYRAVG